VGLVTTYGSGQYATGESHFAGWDRAYKTGGRGIIWAHSAGSSTSQEPWLPANNSLPLMQALGSLGCPIMAGDFAGNSTWGNDNAQARITDAWTWLKSQYGAKTDKVILAGVSMGGINVLNWARANPTLVQAILLFYPVVNLQAQHDGTGGALAINMTSAYGDSTTLFAAAAPSHDPAQHASSYMGVPIYMGHSDVDTIVGSANQSAFATAVGGSALTERVYTGAGHADMTKPDVAEVQSWIASYL
jgi:predicted esterase